MLFRQHIFLIYVSAPNTWKVWVGPNINFFIMIGYILGWLNIVFSFTYLSLWVWFWIGWNLIWILFSYCDVVFWWKLNSMKSLWRWWYGEVIAWGMIHMTVVMKIDMRSLLLLFSEGIRLKGPKMSTKAYCALLEKLTY